MERLHALEAFARLKGLRSNIPNDKYEVVGTFVQDYHEILNLLQESLNIDLSGFLVPGNMVQPTVTLSNYLTGEKTYSREPYCLGDYFRSKLDGALTMTEMLLSKEDEKMGFKPKK